MAGRDMESLKDPFWTEESSQSTDTVASERNRTVEEKMVLDINKK